MSQSKKASMADPDRISALPDAVLSHVLTFLQSQEAVRSCVLARRWLHLWKSVPVLRVTGGHVKESRGFMEHLLILRDRTPLDTCILKFHRAAYDDMRHVMLWIRYALLCQVRVLNVAFSRAVIWPLSRAHLVSQNLTELKLDYVCVQDNFLDFSNCVALVKLKMTECYIHSDRISSTSLRSLSIVDCSLSDNPRFRISAPRLVSLEISASIGVIPLLEDMPELVTASVTFGHEGGDSFVRPEMREWICSGAYCECCDANSYCGDACCECCYGPDDAIDAGCVLLNGLSAATNLKLVAESDVVLFKLLLLFAFRLPSSDFLAVYILICPSLS
uniref:Uncharacterized protein n=2 Tax=Avena sativa TaxID=4498 RepID=A0ACD5XJ70_AVESA